MNDRYNNVFVRIYHGYKTIIVIDKHGKKVEFVDNDDSFDKSLVNGTKVQCAINGNPTQKSYVEILTQETSYLVPSITYDENDTAYFEVFSNDSS